MKPSKKLLRTIVCLLIGLSITAPCMAQTPAEAAKDRWVAHVTSVQGGVYIQHAGKSRWETLKVAARCYPGDSIRVDENSRAALLFKNDSTLRVDQNSHLTFQPMEEQTIRMRLFKGTACFFSRFPRSLKIFTPHMNGTVKGTEFVIRVDGDETQLTLFEGQVLAENEKGELLLVGGQSIVATKGQAPVFVTVVRPRDAVQWALYYPAIQDFSPGDFPGEADWLVKSRVSVEAWRKGDHAGALGVLKEVRDEGVEDTHYLLYRASLALSVGRIDDVSAYLDRTLKIDPKNANAYALQSIIATTQNNKVAGMDLATKAVNLDPQSSAARVALSYAQQARFDLNGAMASTQEAVKLSPSDAYARARLAELWLAQGYLKRALEEARRAVQINPHIARTQVVLGYAYLTQVEIDKSRAAFEKAIALDSADPLPRLGLGLAKIRKGDLEEGRQEIEIAASLDPDNSLIRSYLGKAYYEEKRDNLASSQFDRAKELDPLDPTPFFYDAIRKQSVNQPVEALHDLQKSIELNDNRAVYRSRLLLDSDLAARSASLGRIYRDLDFQQLALVEGWKSVNTDPADFSGHRFLADTYAALPRHEIARVSELLQSQLLQPINISPVQPHLVEGDLLFLSNVGPLSLSFNEYSSLFNRNRLALQASGFVGSQGTVGEEIVQSGVWNKLSYSIGQSHSETDGFRENNDLTRDLYDVFVQGMLSENTSLQSEFRAVNTHNGDRTLNFLPWDFQRNQRESAETRTIRVGFRQTFWPGSDLIGNFVYQSLDSKVNDPSFAFDIQEDSKSYSGELQHLLRLERFSVVAGGGFFNVSGKEDISIVFSDPDYGTIRSFRTVDRDIKHTNVYLYSQIYYPKNVTLTLGASGDFFSGGIVDRNQFNPKAGLTWTPLVGTTLRVAAFRTFKRSLINNQTLEPTQVAGFNQFFDDFEATPAWNFGGAVDQKLSNNLTLGAELRKRDLDVPFFIGSDSSDTQVVDWNEWLGRAYLYWTPHPWFALSAEYFYEKMDRDYEFTFGISHVVTHRVPLGVGFFHPSGISARVTASYIDQSGTFQPQGPGIPLVSGSDRFWVVDASLSYRLPRRFGIISVGAKNLFDKSFLFQDTDPVNPRMQPRQFVFASMTLTF